MEKVGVENRILFITAEESSLPICKAVPQEIRTPPTKVFGSHCPNPTRRPDSEVPVHVLTRLWGRDEPFGLPTQQCQAEQIFHIPLARLMKSEASSHSVFVLPNARGSLILLPYSLLLTISLLCTKEGFPGSLVQNRDWTRAVPKNGHVTYEKMLAGQAYIDGAEEEKGNY